MIDRGELSQETASHLLSVPGDGATRFLMADGTIRGVLIYGTGMIARMAHYHETPPLETLILGRAYLGAALLGRGVEGNDRIILSVVCDGPVGGFQAESDRFGNVRGYLHRNPIPLDDQVPARTSDLFGKGILKVTRIAEGNQGSYTGSIELKYGSIGEDLAGYFFFSEQIPTSVTLGIEFADNHTPLGSGALLIQAMPDADPDISGQVEDVVTTLPGLGKTVARGVAREEFITRYFEEYSPKIIDTGDVRFFCPCSKAHFGTFLVALEEQKRAELMEEGDYPLELRCHNCNSTYLFEEQELQDLLHKKNR